MLVVVHFVPILFPFFFRWKGKTFLLLDIFFLHESCLMRWISLYFDGCVGIESTRTRKLHAHTRNEKTRKTEIEIKISNEEKSLYLFGLNTFHFVSGISTFIEYDKFFWLLEYSFLSLNAFYNFCHQFRIRVENEEGWRNRWNQSSAATMSIYFYSNVS